MDGAEDKKLNALPTSAAGMKKSSNVEVVSTPNTTMAMVGYNNYLICHFNLFMYIPQ